MLLRPLHCAVAYLTFLTLAALSLGCGDIVVAPERDNPLDPAAPNFRPQPARELVAQPRDHAVHISWERPTSEFVTSVRVERANQGSGFELLVELPTDSTRFMDEGPFSLQTHYRLTAVSKVSGKEAMTVGQAVLLDPGFVAALSVDSVSTHFVRLRWELQSELATHVRVFAREGWEWHLLDVVPAVQNFYEAPIDVRKNITPQFRVEIAHESDLDVGLAGRSISIDLLSRLAPQRVLATFVDEGRVDVSWQNVLEIATSIGIYRSRDSGLPQRIGTVDPSVSVFVDETALMNDALHRYSIRAEYDGGHTPFSHSELVEQRIEVPVIDTLQPRTRRRSFSGLGPTPRAREHIVRRSVDGGLFEEIARRPATGGEFTDRPPAGASRLTYEVRTLASGGRS
jgi:hypothetical protein